MPLPLIPMPRRELVAAGLADRDLDVMLQTGRANAPFRGIIVDAAVPLDLLTRCRAALATQDEDAAIGHETAAALLRLAWLPPLWSLPDARIHVVVQRDDQHRHRNGLRLHRALLPDSDVILVAGVRCTNPARTIVDLARRRDANRLLTLQLVDGVLRMQKCTSADLGAALGAAGGLRNVARARTWFGLAREGVDSPRETELRLILHDGGIDDIQTNIEICDEEDGTVLARADLGSRRLLLWGEYDGYDTHSERPTFRSDRVGDRWLERRGWHVMRFVDADLRRKARTVHEWKSAAAQAPARIAAMDPRRSPEVAAARRLLGFD